MKKKNVCTGIIAVSFGIGLLLACICPSNWLVTLLAIALVIMGITCHK